ncbi:nuclear transport factor 2 family protein [Rhodococcus sp. NPDC056960]|jgi:limonene-1,2-epoxide hydrolase|uniref:nuclear transport factor 2 family protein n=1 Tax=Rhodococcus sp. NPDC056960 TaxID=3345982 RepID=UPI003630A043
MTQTTIDLESTIRAFYREVDANDPEVFRRRLAADAVFAFNDVDPVAGVEAIDAFVSAWKGNFHAVLHQLDLLVVDSAKNTVAVEITVSYLFSEDNEVKVKGSSFVELAGSDIISWRVYVDTSRLS